jgi:hypothetical protein
MRRHGLSFGWKSGFGLKIAVGRTVVWINLGTVIVEGKSYRMKDQIETP